MPYSLDTSYLVDAWNIWYPYEQFKEAWRLWASVAAAADMFVIGSVRGELRRHTPDLVRFYDAHVPGWWIDVSRDARLRQEMANLEQTLIQEGYKAQRVQRYMQTADPAVVLHAQLYQHAVVSIEKSAPQAKTEPKLPDLCAQRGVRHLYPHELLADLGHTFAPAEP